MTSTPEDAPAELPWRDPPAPGAKVTAAIHETCTRGLHKQRGMTATRRALLSLVVAGSVAGALIVLGHAPGGGARDAALSGAIGWGIVLAFVLFFGLARPPGRRGSRSVRLTLAIGLPVLFFVHLAMAAANILPFGRFVHEGVTHTSTCGLFSLAFGALAAGGLLFLWRRTDPLTPGLSGALAGLCGGLASAVGIGVACPSHEGWHLWLAHGTTLLVFVAAGAVAGRKWLTP
jgi:hypothetical protein